MGELRRSFSPEFLNRIDEIVVSTRSRRNTSSISRYSAARAESPPSDKSVNIEVDDEVKQWLIKEGYEPLYGARPMRRIIQRAIGDPLSEGAHQGRFKG